MTEGPYRMQPRMPDEDERSMARTIALAVVYGLSAVLMLALLGWLVLEALYWLEWLAR